MLRWKFKSSPKRILPKPFSFFLFWFPKIKKSTYFILLSRFKIIFSKKIHTFAPAFPRWHVKFPLLFFFFLAAQTIVIHKSYLERTRIMQLKMRLCAREKQKDNPPVYVVCIFFENVCTIKVSCCVVLVILCIEVGQRQRKGKSLAQEVRQKSDISEHRSKG